MSDAAERHANEALQRQRLEEIFQDTELSNFELFRNFPVYAPRFNLARFLAHYEIFKKIVDLPGVIVDLGVYRGASTFTWAKLCEIFCPTDIRKTVYGFDTFAGFTALAAADGPADPVQGRVIGGYAAGAGAERDLLRAAAAMDADRHLGHIPRIRLIKGDVAETLPRFVAEKGEGLRIALLNLDLDLYEPTRLALETLYPRMVRGGIIIADEYAIDSFGGESKAVDEFFLEHTGRKPKVRKFPWHSNPSAYIEVD
ncbi:TylF/MycF/NovP-related O-methyltransferase [Azospirillum sp. ST 5-10]|uniref:TylF/MycF/NovP-related O-methyltransferase n=1 Tax=unclassified Azospirillum TaxID=2630922 RepID=UPI003F49E767